MDKEKQATFLSGAFSRLNLNKAEKGAEVAPSATIRVDNCAGSSASAGSSSDLPSLVRRVTNAHRDDIHGMVSVNDHIVTGSKDTSVRMWSDTGDLQDVVLQHPATTATQYSYSNWITALHAFPDGSVMVGSRNGYVVCKNIHDKKIYYRGILEHQLVEAMLEAGTPSSRMAAQHGKTPGRGNHYRGAAVYKERNEPRITSITCQDGDGYSALIGMPEKFVQLDLETQTIRRVYNFNSPEWVYGFAQLNQQTIAVIHACTLSAFREVDVELPHNGWEKVDTFVREGTRLAAQRAFISDVNQFKEAPARLALAFFGGMTRVIDTENSGRVIHEGHEHQGRVWKTVPVDATSYISCADDALIKVWDVRQGASVRTYSGHPDRVSALAILRNNMFVAASCPKNPHDDPDKGQLFFYDRRR